MVRHAKSPPLSAKLQKALKAVETMNVSELMGLKDMQQATSEIDRLVGVEEDQSPKPKLH